MPDQINVLTDQPLPVDIILAPAWWHKNAGLTFEQDFFFDPLRRVEAEQKMEQVLYERWGDFGLGKQRNQRRPEIGAVHLAAGFLISEMLGCQVDYYEDNPPQVIPAFMDKLQINEEAAFQSDVYQKYSLLVTRLLDDFGYLSGDINWGGILNIALDLRGQDLFFDMVEQPEHIKKEFKKIYNVISRFLHEIEQQTGTTSISVNRNVVNLQHAVFLHSECSHTMISVEHYDEFLFRHDEEWCRQHRPYGIHYCGEDPHRYAESFARLPHLDFLDVGWGGDLKTLRQHLPATFLNIRLSPVEIISWSVSEIEKIIRQLVADSGNPWLTGVCCINMDEKVSDENITAIFRTVRELRHELRHERGNNAR